MKIIEHLGRPKIDYVKLETNPLVIWLGTRTELWIKPGDRLEKVVDILIKRKWGLSRKELRRVVAYWFALGERIASQKPTKKWTERELRPNPSRRYKP